MHYRLLATAAVIAALGGVSPVLLAQAAKPARSDAPAVGASTGFNVLQGRWVRPDGGYTIAIRGVAADGQLDAMYFNPNGLPFAKALATLDGKLIRVALELRAGGYNGSTYELTYDPASDQLKGTYYQAVAQQRYEIFFVRK